jgi:hypothetical protein
MDVEGKPQSSRALIGQTLASISTLNAHQQGRIDDGRIFFGTGLLASFASGIMCTLGGRCQEQHLHALARRNW